MAEILGITASVVSLATLAEGAAFLYTFFRDIRDAPSNVKRLSDELRSITSILLTIQRSSTTTQNPELEEALKLSNAVINDISTILKPLQQSSSMKRRQKAWKRFRAVLKHSDLTDRFDALERCKSMLLQCCSTAIMYVCY